MHASLKPFIEQAPRTTVREGIRPEKLVSKAEVVGGRPGEAHEMAGVVDLLCTPENGCCTDQAISASGGMQFGLQ